MNILILYWYYAAHVMFFSISLISFFSYILAKYITVLLYDVRLSHLNKDYLLTY